jgi:hypothetical protein
MDAAAVPGRPSITIGTPPATEGRGQQWFYVTAGLLFIVLNLAGFGPSILDQSARRLPLTWLVVAHGTVTGGLGRRGFDLSGDVVRAISRTGSRSSAATTLFPLAELLSFACLVVMALWYRRRPEVHKRLMLFALIVMVNEPLLHLVGHLSSHWPMLKGSGIRISGPMLLVLLSASAVNDRLSLGQIRRVSLVTPILLIAWQVVIVFVVFPSEVWHRCAAWLVR